MVSKKTSKIRLKTTSLFLKQTSLFILFLLDVRSQLQTNVSDPNNSIDFCSLTS